LKKWLVSLLIIFTLFKPLLTLATSRQASLNPLFFTVALLPIDGEFSSLSHLTAQLAQQHKTEPASPHLTLYYGKIADAKHLIPYVRKMFANDQPFKLKIKDIEASDSYFKTVYITFVDIPELAAKVEALRALAYSKDYFWEPHLSLLYKDMPLAQKKSIAKQIIINQKSVIFAKVQVALYQVDAKNSNLLKKQIVDEFWLN